MGSFGENLRREREARGISLDEISETTKISVRLLQAIENEEFDRLPGGVFNVNFVRQYARQVGLDEDRIVGDFRAMTAEPEEAAVVQRPGTSSPEWTVPSSPEYEWDRERRNRMRAWGTMGLAAVALAAATFLVVRNSAPPPPASAPSPAPVTPPQSAPAPTAEAKPEPPPPAPPPEPVAPIRVELQASDAVWVSAVADGKTAFVATLQPDQRREATAHERLRLRVGNAGALKITLNGEEQPAIGPVGFPRTVIFTTAGMEVIVPAETSTDASPEPPGKETPP